jgi:peptidoglycan/xylan/chitin deacetylase (PgdA/CDA1 family)
MKHGTGFYCFLLGLILGLSAPAAEPAKKLSFSGLDISHDNRLLFRADSGSGQGVIFVSRLTDLALQQITAFPEQMDLVGDGRILLVRNSFGAVRVPVSGGLPRPAAGFPSLAAGTVPGGGNPAGSALSADGRWILYIEPEGFAYGNLILLDLSDGSKRVISRRIELPARDFPASWSPDSRLFVYAKGGRLFYCPADYTPSNPVDRRPIDERYREIGEGGINAVCWGRQGDFFYLKGNTLYLVRGSELYTRIFYGDFLSIGSVAGRLPVDFDALFDRFWLAPDFRSILVSKAGKTIFYCPLDGAGNTPLPYVMSPGGSYNISVLWSASGLITISAFTLAGDTTMTWRVETGKEGASFFSLDAAPSFQCSLSPDGTRVLFWGETGLSVWDYANWEPLRTLKQEPVYSCVWLNNREIIAGDKRRIEQIDLSGRRRLVCLADADSYGFEEGEENARILALCDGVWFASGGNGPWTEAGSPRLRPAAQTTGRYRVFLEPLASGPCENIPMIRDITSAGTASLLTALMPAVRAAQERRPTEVTDKADNAGGGVTDGVFIHGRRDGARQAALCFDLYDDDAGLAGVLDALNRFDVKATFFMNGDFIRSSPGAAAAIARAGHEAASMFYAPIDLAGSRYRISPEYIARGLARNEDDFHKAAGAELGLLWHPPFYRSSAEISAAASKAAYLTIGRDVDPLDWVSREDARKLELRQYSAPEMIERIMEAVQPGSIIPIRLGLLSGGRDDYLFLRLEVLLDALIRSGYTIVPVSALVGSGSR